MYVDFQDGFLSFIFRVPEIVGLIHCV